MFRPKFVLHFIFPVSAALRESTYPFLALICRRDNRMTVVGRMEGMWKAFVIILSHHSPRYFNYFNRKECRTFCGSQYASLHLL